MNMMGFKKKKKDKNLIIIAGCGRLGSSIASLLSPQGKDVVIIDRDGNSFRKLSPDYGGFSIEADATDINTLKDAGIDEASILMAFTDNDNTNIMIAQIAKKIFLVSKVITRLYDTEKESILNGSNIYTINPARLSITAVDEIFARAREVES
jgi:trk system potassium uptake protein TrkA